MSIDWYRDLAIVILGLAGTATALFIGVLAFVLYRKISPILDSTKKTIKTVEHLSACVEEEVAPPLSRIVALMTGVTQAVSLFSRLFRRKEGGKHDSS